MCGITGFVSSANRADRMAVAQAMTATLARRGPDGEGIAEWPGACLGHRRLAILDLSDAGRQPMVSPDGRTGLVFNGCIYNFAELRAELEERGFAFRSHCDTEVLLHGYAAWGIDALVQRLRGMFAFAIWDERLEKLFLVRDRLGVKPLVYSASSRGIAFASTIAALAAGGFTGDVNRAAVMEFLEFGVVTDEEAIYEGVTKLPPATIAEWKGGRISHRCYWTLPPIDERRRITFDEAVEETERLILDSVRVRLCSDVPVGALLSGGIDSALICWAMRELNADIRAFTVSTPGDPADESPAARETARLLGIPLNTVVMETRRTPLGELIDAYSEPFACESAMGMLRLCETIKPEATVLLTGDGGDDIYLGYPYFHNAWRAQRVARALPPGGEAIWRMMRPAIRTLPQLRRAAHFLDYATGGLGPYRRVREGIRFYERRHMLGERLDGAAVPQREGEASVQSARALVQELFDYHRRTALAGEFLPKVDGTSMYFGIETRSPLLDQKIWEFGAALPPAVRFRQGRLKAVLREIVRRRIGPEVAFRGKRGFTIPVDRWLLKEWRDSLESLCSGTLLEEQGWIRRGALATHIRKAVAQGSAPSPFWYLIVLEAWLRREQRRRSAPSGMAGAGSFHSGRTKLA